jgi:putative Holliday junction resolvase
MITLEEFKKKQLDKCRLIGLDLGSKRIGVSICDEKQLIATPFKTIKRSTAKEVINELRTIIEENDIKGIIIGNPLNMDGTSGSSAQSVKDTSENIEKSINLPVCLWDERLSTVGAFNLSSQLDVNVSKREKKIDENAAAFILQGAIDFLNN